MGMHIEKEYTLYWSGSHRLGRFIGLKRFDQLHRYFHLRDETINPRQSCEEWFWRIEPIGTMIRLACQSMWSLGTHLSIDEAMIAFTGRTDHTIKIKNKPVSQGFKVWCLAEKGYIWSWLWHSGEDAVEGIPQKGIKAQMPFPFLPILLSPTFALVIVLAQQAVVSRPSQVFCLFLDNLFLKLDVAQALLAIGVLCMGTTRKNSKGLPQELIDLKNQNQSLLWDSALARIINSVYCFLWQDNNAMLGITTAYSLAERTLRERKRPALTSTNARIVRPVFGDTVKKWLYIPTAIDCYNHHMNGVDRNNQLRRNMTVCRAKEQRVWRPIWLWLLDISLVNAFLIWKEGKEDKRRRGHRRFRQALCEQLLRTPDVGTESIQLQAISDGPGGHTRLRFSKSNYCVQCKPARPKQGSQQRRFGDVLPANVPGNVRQRGSRTFGGCQQCGVYLCVQGTCFDSYHSRKG